MICTKLGGLHNLKSAVDKMWEGIDYNNLVREAFTKFKKPPVMITEEERKKIGELVE